MARSVLAATPTLIMMTMVVATEAVTGTSRGVVPPNHPVHTLSAERLRKIHKHDPVLLPHHPDHHNNPLLDAMRPATLSLSPADLGGDPTGQADSTWAVQVNLEWTL